MQKYIDSYIVGDFEGWDGDAVYELDDGSRWELASYRYVYVFRYHPHVIVWREGARYYLEVEGMPDKQEVRAV